MDKSQPEIDELVQQRMAAREKLNKSYLAVFSSPEGQLVLEDLMYQHGFFQAHPADAQRMAIKEGERAVILRILQILQTNPQQIVERIRDEVV